MNTIPEGELFARLYAERKVPLVDSKTFRNRIAAFYDHNFYEFDSDFCNKTRQLIEQETGILLKNSYSSTFQGFFITADIVNVLTAITLIWRLLTGQRRVADAYSWQQFVERTLREENLTYKVDKKCGIHPSVDQEFDTNRMSSLACLADARYKTVDHALQQSFKELEKLPMNGKAAARDVFEAAESVMKIMLGTGASLDSALVEKDLRQICDRLFAADAQVKSATGRLVSSFAKWVDAIHPYRHGHDRDEPLILPDDLAVLAVSQGASYIRWLVDVDRRNRNEVK